MTSIPGMDTALNPAEEIPDIDRYDLGEKGKKFCRLHLSSCWEIQ